MMNHRRWGRVGLAVLGGAALLWAVPPLRGAGLPAVSVGVLAAGWLAVVWSAAASLLARDVGGPESADVR